MRLEDIVQLEEALGRDEGEALAEIRRIVARAREAARPLPVPPPDAPPPPRPYQDGAEEDWP